MGDQEVEAPERDGWDEIYEAARDVVAPWCPEPPWWLTVAVNAAVDTAGVRISNSSTSHMGRKLANVTRRQEAQGRRIAEWRARAEAAEAMLALDEHATPVDSAAAVSKAQRAITAHNARQPARRNRAEWSKWSDERDRLLRLHEDASAVHREKKEQGWRERDALWLASRHPDDAIRRTLLAAWAAVREQDSAALNAALTEIGQAVGFYDAEVSGG